MTRGLLPRAALALACLGLLVVLYQALAILVVERTARPERADVLIVLGPRLSGERLDPLGRARAVEAARLWKAGYAPFIVATGGVVAPGTIPEGEALRREIIALGVDPGVVLVEPGSRNTAENLAGARELMKARGWRRAVVVSNRFHLRRALILAERLGMAATASGGDPEPWALSNRAWWFAREVGASVYHGAW